MNLQRLPFSLIIHAFSTLNGLFTVRYSRASERFVEVRWLRWYSLVVRATLLLVLLPLFVHVTLNPPEVSIMKFFPYTIYTRLINNFNLLSIAVNAVLFCGWRQQRLLHIWNKLLALERQCFRRLPEKCAGIHESTDSLLYARFVILTVHSALILSSEVFSQLSLISFTTKGIWFSTAIFVCDFFILLFVHGINLHYFLLLCYICGRYELINRRLRALQRQATHIVVCDCSDELWQLHWAHTQLTRLVGELTDIYKYQIFAKVMLYFTYLTSGGYTFVVVVSTNYAVSFIAFIMEGTQDILLLLDIYNFNCLAECAMNSFETISRTLQCFAEVPHMHRRSEQACNWFALHLSWNRLHINLFNVLTLNRRQTFLLVAQIILHTIILVQSDYKNL